jgi:hypothetical protein
MERDRIAVFVPDMVYCPEQKLFPIAFALIFPVDDKIICLIPVTGDRAYYIITVHEQKDIIGLICYLIVGA